MSQNEQNAIYPEPIVFISHREEDKKIADLFRNFIKDRSNGKVKVFQSSYEGSGPTVGEILNKDLGDHLYRSEVVLLIYTIADENWSYCMWECGVAYDPNNRNTRIIVLQCGKQDPAPLSERVKIKLYSEAGVCKFVTEFMTGKDFFPRYGQPITNFSPEDDVVKKAGLELFSELKGIKSNYSSNNWPAWPHIKLDIKSDHVEQVILMLKSNRKEAISFLQSKCCMYDQDKYASSLFGIIDFGGFNIETLEDLVSHWESKNPSQSPLWAEALSSQIINAIKGEFLNPAWALFKNAHTGHLHSPLLAHVRSSRDSIKLDIYFPSFETDKESRPIFRTD